MIITERLILEPLSTNDSGFLIELVNTDGWQKFIGKRNIHSTGEASAYIKKYIDDENTNIQTVKLKDTKTPIGIITVLKREYLEFKDIGFALLPVYFHKGYAFEAAKAVLDDIAVTGNIFPVEAITIPENESSIKLLKKLGFKFDKEIMVENKKNFVFKLMTEDTQNQI